MSTKRQWFLETFLVALFGIAVYVSGEYVFDTVYNFFIGG